MKLIMENWRGFLKEQEQQYTPRYSGGMAPPGESRSSAGDYDQKNIGEPDQEYLAEYGGDCPDCDFAMAFLLNFIPIGIAGGVLTKAGGVIFKKLINTPGARKVAQSIGKKLQSLIKGKPKTPKQPGVQRAQVRERPVWTIEDNIRLAKETIKNPFKRWKVVRQLKKGQRRAAAELERLKAPGGFGRPHPMGPSPTAPTLPPAPFRRTVVAPSGGRVLISPARNTTLPTGPPSLE